MSDFLESHAAFNKLQTLGGIRVDSTGTKPSVYITGVKLKKALTELSDIEIENIHGREMTPYDIRVRRERLGKKITRIEEWQLFHALNILRVEGNYDAFCYILKCDRRDAKPQ